MNLKLRENTSHGTPEYPYCQHRIQGVPYGFHFPVHWHEELEIIYVREGQLQVNVAGTDYPMNSGEVLIVNPRQLHLMKSDDVDVFYYTMLFPVELISFQTQDLLEQQIFHPLRTGEGMLPNRLPAKALTKEAVALLDRVIDANVRKESFYQLETRLYLLQFLMEILRNTQLVTADEDHAGKMHRQMLEYIRMHYRRRITLEDLAEQFHLSPKYLSRYFKENFHLTISEYISHLRISHAKELLEHTDLSITEVADQCGFSSVSFFIRQFRNAAGCAPGKWRKQSYEA